MYARMYVRIRMYICTVCMWERVTYPAVPFALDLEGGAGRSKSLRVLSEPNKDIEREAMPQIDGLHVCMYV